MKTTETRQDIRELSETELQAVSGAMSVTPGQIAGFASQFTSSGGGTTTTGIIVQPRPRFPALATVATSAEMRSAT